MSFRSLKEFLHYLVVLSMIDEKSGVSLVLSPLRFFFSLELFKGFFFILGILNFHEDISRCGLFLFIVFSTEVSSILFLEIISSHLFHCFLFSGISNGQIRPCGLILDIF